MLSLQRAQAEFDARCGFDFAAADQESDGMLHRIEFASLALCGEAGEVANLVKKARRAAWLGLPKAPDVDDLADELADVFAYTLKLSNLLGVDLQRSYERKMHENTQRFASPPRVLTVMGPPGVGKTSVVRRLAKRFPAYIEDATRNPALAEMSWGKPKRETLTSQLWFLHALRQLLREADRNRPLIVDQDPRAVVAVYGSLLREQGALHDDGVAELANVLREVEADLAEWNAGRVTVLLDASPEVLEARVRERDGDGVGLPSLAHLRTRFAQLAHDFPDVLVLRTDQLDADLVATRVQEHLLAA